MFSDRDPYIYLNKSPIVWYSKRQAATYGSEFVALRIATELIEALRYKLRMFSIPIDRPKDDFCNNQSVVTSSSMLESTLSKKHNDMSYHRVRETFTQGTIRVTQEDTATNLADLF